MKLITIIAFSISLLFANLYENSMEPTYYSLLAHQIGTNNITYTDFNDSLKISDYTETNSITKLSKDNFNYVEYVNNFNSIITENVCVITYSFTDFLMGIAIIPIISYQKSLDKLKYMNN